MTMTEQEIRADEREKIVRDLWNFRPCLHGAANTGVLLAIQFITGVRPDPKPEPKITVNWSTFPWYASPKPTKDWRDVPVTAKMLREAYGPSVSNPLCQEEVVGSIIERLAREAVAP